MNKQLRVICFLLFCVCFTRVSLANPYSSNDVLAFKRIGQVLVSPDSTQTAWTVWQVNNTRSEKKWEALLYLKNQKDKIVKLAGPIDSISSLNWSPDSKEIAYISKGEKYQSIWIYDLKNQTNKKFYEFSADIETFKWSPNQKYIGFVAAPNINKTKHVPIDVSKDFNNLRLYRLTLNNKNTEALTSSDWSITPFFDAGFTWAPDSQTIAFAYQPRVGAAYTEKSKIAFLDLKSHQIKKIEYFEDHIGVQPTYSLDGKWLAFRTNLGATKVANDLNNEINLLGKICIFQLKSAEIRCLSNTFNESPIILGWNKNSNAVLVFDAYKSKGYEIYDLNIDASQPAKNISNTKDFIEPLTLSLNSTGTMFGFGYEAITIRGSAPILVKRYQMSQIPC